MKLIQLQLIPDGNPHGEVITVAIDHNPDVFKSSYVCVAQMRDGSLQVTHRPPNISQQELDDAYRHALVIIDMVYDITSGF